jgi:hypothetical protein
VLELGSLREAEGNSDGEYGLAAPQLREREENAVVSCAFPAAPQP